MMQQLNMQQNLETKKLAKLIMISGINGSLNRIMFILKFRNYWLLQHICDKIDYIKAIIWSILNFLKYVKNLEIYIKTISFKYTNYRVALSKKRKKEFKWGYQKQA